MIFGAAARAALFFMIITGSTLTSTVSSGSEMVGLGFV
jgi:hypothetical protein